MTATAYRGVPTLADYFLDLIRQGLFPDEAAGHLTAEIRREHLVLDPHPRWPFHLTPTTDGLIVETANGRRDDASEFLISIERTGRHTTLFVADPPSVHEQAAVASTESVMQAPPSIEEQGIERLVAELKQDQASDDGTKTKAIYRKLLKQALGIGADKFDTVIWPAATKAPGVKPVKGGRPRKKK